MDLKGAQYAGQNVKFLQKIFVLEIALESCVLYEYFYIFTEWNSGRVRRVVLKNKSTISAKLKLDK